MKRNRAMGWAVWVGGPLTAAGLCAAPCAAPCAAALANPGGGGLSGTLSKNPAIKKQQLIADPDTPDAGSLSVAYDASVARLVATALPADTYTFGPGYTNQAGQPAAYVLCLTGTTGSMQQQLVPIDTFRTTSGGSQFPPPYVELGYIQVLYRRDTASMQSPGRITATSGYTTVDSFHGEGAIDAPSSVDVFGLFFQPAPGKTGNETAGYKVFAAAAGIAGTSAGSANNTADFMQKANPGGYTLAYTQINPHSNLASASDVQGVSANFVPEPSSAAIVLGMATAGLLARRRRRS